MANFKGKFNGGDGGWKMNNHVSQHGTQLNDQMQKKFGITLDDIERARNYDEASLAKLFDAGIQGQNSQFLMPILEQACKDGIKGTEVYNTSISRILGQAGSSAVAVDKAANATSMAELKLKNSYKEMTSDLAQKAIAENQRHGHQMEFQKLASYINMAVVMTNQTFQINNTITQPDRLQQDEDKRYYQEAVRHLSQYGSEGIENVQRKQFTGTDTEFVKADWKATTMISNTYNKLKSAFGFGS